MPEYGEDTDVLDALHEEPSSDQGYVTAMSHFYRGEIGRMMVWRQRLDTTTTWAITSTGTIFTVAFSFETVPHLIFFFNLAIVAIMLGSRRGAIVLRRLSRPCSYARGTLPNACPPSRGTQTRR